MAKYWGWRPSARRSLRYSPASRDQRRCNRISIPTLKELQMNLDHAYLGHEDGDLTGAHSARDRRRREQEEAQLDVDSIGSPAHKFVRRRWMKYETAQRI